MSTSVHHNLLVLISGNGSNLQAIIDACGQNPLNKAQICRVISNKKDAYGLTRAKNADIPTIYHNVIAGGYKKRHPEDPVKAREEYDIDLANLIIQNDPKPDLVVCAGWMHILSPPFIDRLSAAKVPIINLHPALPGQFDGHSAIERAWKAHQEAGLEYTGVMIHYVISEVDRGTPIVTERVSMTDVKDLEALEQKIHDVEHHLIVEGTGKALAEIEKVDET